MTRVAAIVVAGASAGALLSSRCAIAAGDGADATGARAPAAGDARNVLLICVDTLRADRIGCYGASRPTSPRIDALAERGLRFERAYGTAPWTLPSTASLMTGLQPDLHRADSFLASISPDARMLAEELTDEGFETQAFIGNYFVQSLFGFERGFAGYDGDCMVDRGGINSDRLSDKAIAWLERPHAKPFFLYLHYFDPHYNYWEHEGWKFGGEETDRVFSGEDIYELRDHLKEFDDADRARLDALYDSEVAFTDHHLGRVLARLDELGLASKTIVVLTADHGESLGEHGWIGHTIQLYDESVRIPLIVAGPGVAPAVRRGDPFQTDDVWQPLLRLSRGEDAGDWSSRAGHLERGLLPDEALVSVEITGLDEPEEPRLPKSVHQGAWRLFVDRGDGGEETYRLFKTDEPKGRRRKRPEDFPSEMKQLLAQRKADLEQRRKEIAASRSVMTRRRALVKGAFKAIVDEVSGAVELYDLDHDPKERHDLAAEQPERATAMRKRLDELVAALKAAALREGPGVSAEAAEEQRKRIEQIGYGNGK